MESLKKIFFARSICSDKLIKVAKGVVFVSLVFLQAACSVFGIRTEETPKYEVLLTEDQKQIRSYSGYIVAKTTVQGEYKDAQNRAFRILASYIFGNNEKQQKISMTAPVSQNKDEQREQISMTAPVVSAQEGENWVMTFMMPAKYTMTDLPKPKDARVSFAEVPPKLVAVIQYSGYANDRLNTAKAQELKTWLESHADYKIVSGPSFAGYDPPWTLPFLRRNEMMYEVQRKKAH